MIIIIIIIIGIRLEDVLLLLWSNRSIVERPDLYNTWLVFNSEMVIDHT